MPLFWISLSFIAGIVLASLLPLPTWAWISVSATFFLLSLFLRYFASRNSNYALLLQITHYTSRSRLAFILHAFSFTLLISLFLGSAFYQFRQPNIDAFHIAFYNDRTYDLLITGFLVEPPDTRDKYTNLKLKVEAVDSGSGDLPVSGLILVRVAKNQTYEYGQLVRVRGQLKTPPEDEQFSYRDYLAREDRKSTRLNSSHG